MSNWYSINDLTKFSTNRSNFFIKLALILQRCFVFLITEFCFLIYSLVYYPLIAIIFWQFIVISWLIFSIIKLIVDIILKIRLGKQYGGLFRVEDAIFDRIESTKCVVTGMVIFKSETPMDMIGFIRKTFKEKVFDRPYDDYIKLTGTRHTLLGYSYYKKNDYSHTECIRPLPMTQEPFTDDDLMDISSQLINAPFPKQDGAMWELLVSETYMKNKNEDSPGYRYAVLIRLHHAVSDGTSLVAFLMNTLSCTTADNYNMKIFNKKKNHGQSLFENIPEFVISLISYIKIYLYLICITPGKNLVTMMLKGGSKNAIHGPECTGNANIVWPTAKTANYVTKIKDLKNRIPNTKFSQIIFTGVSVSLARYFKRHEFSIPDSVIAIIPRILHYPDLDNSKPTKLLNKTSMFFLDLYTNETVTVLDALKQVKKYMGKVNTLDVMANYVLSTKIVGIFPRQLTATLAPLDYVSLIITNIPGGSEVKLSDTLCVERVIPIPPVAGGVGVSIATLTYGDQFTIGLHVEKSIIPSKKEAQKIVDDLLLSIRALDMETKHFEPTAM